MSEAREMPGMKDIQEWPSFYCALLAVRGEGMITDPGLDYYE